MSVTMLRIGLLCVALLVAPLCSGMEALAQRNDRSLENLVSRIQGRGDGKVYLIDVYELTDDRFFGFLLKFRCTNCESDYVYEEIVENYFDFGFALSDELIVTKWSTGVASGIQVYLLGEEVRRVVEFYGRGGPGFTYSESGEPEVITYDFRDEDLLETYYRATWTWDGKELLETKECIAGCEALRERRPQAR